jgi:hypothetical protein
MADSQAHNQGGQDRFVFNCVPILVVPGVAGSRLHFNSGGPHWDVDQNLEMFGIAGLRLSERADHIAFTQPATVIEALSSASSAAIGTDVRLQALARRWLGQTNWALVGTPEEQARFAYRERGWGTLGWNWYGPILTHLETALNPPGDGPVAYPVYGVGYDWRQPNRESGQFLAQRIQRILEGNPNASQVVVVTHSMGGLVARSAVMQDDQARANILGIVHTVMPAAGAFQHYRRFHTGWRLALDGSGAGIVGFLADLVFGRILGGANPAAYARVMCRLQGPMELLPTPKNNNPWLFWRDRDPHTGADIDLNNLDLGRELWTDYLKQNYIGGGIVPDANVPIEDWFGQPAILLPIPSSPIPIPLPPPPIATDRFSGTHRAMLMDRIRDARAAYEAIFEHERPHAKTYMIYGGGVTTDGGCSWTSLNHPIEGRVSQLPTGDGTVESHNAEAWSGTPLRIVRVTGIRHSECFADPTFRNHVEGCVRLALQGWDKPV